MVIQDHYYYFFGSICKSHCLPYIWGKTKCFPSPDVLFKLAILNFSVCVWFLLSFFFFWSLLQIIKITVTLEFNPKVLASTPCLSLELFLLFPLLPRPAISVILFRVATLYCNLVIWGIIRMVFLKLELTKFVFVLMIFFEIFFFIMSWISLTSIRLKRYIHLVKAFSYQERSLKTTTTNKTLKMRGDK